MRQIWGMFSEQEISRSDKLLGYALQLCRRDATPRILIDNIRALGSQKGDQLLRLARLHLSAHEFKRFSGKFENIRRTHVRVRLLPFALPLGHTKSVQNAIKFGLRSSL